MFPAILTTSHNHQVLNFSSAYCQGSLMELEEANSNQNMDDIYAYDAEAEDALSLCDYSINTLAAEEEEDQEEHSSQTQRSSSSTSSSGSDQEQFEFCSEEWSTNTMSYPPENIIFFGKVIAYSEPSSQVDCQNLMSVKETGLIKKPVESFRWNGSHNISSTAKKEEQKLQKVSSVDKQSVLNSLGKFGWSLFLFGGTRFLPTEMALRDIKNRQSRRSPSQCSTLLGLKSDNDKKMSAISNIGSKNRGPHGLLRLLKAIGGGGQRHANNVVKASIGCIPRL